MVAVAEDLVVRDEDSTVEEVVSLHEEVSIAAAIVVEHGAPDLTLTEGKSARSLESHSQPRRLRDV